MRGEEEKEAVAERHVRLKETVSLLMRRLFQTYPKPPAEEAAEIAIERMLRTVRENPRLFLRAAVEADANLAPECPHCLSWKSYVREVRTETTSALRASEKEFARLRAERADLEKRLEEKERIIEELRSSIDDMIAAGGERGCRIEGCGGKPSGFESDGDLCQYHWEIDRYGSTDTFWQGKAEKGEKDDEL